MMKTKTRKQRKAILRGVTALIVGLIMAIAYLSKYTPIKSMAVITAWAYTGWIFAGLVILYGLCEIFIEGDL